MQEFLLDLALNGKVSTYDYSELMELRKEVNAIGRNVNQIVRYIHETGTVEPEAFEMLRQEIKEMNKAIMTEFKEGNLLKENANYESTPNQKD
ncbi:MAG: plasmid mobilization relaxosome protein MobC [Streptococcus sp.]|nr:plasmid mobilization relaxosome protein MobC [Streptococcus sp.]MDU4507819.1 plasmid mobilization relaxosome protein MobC [Streptococcus sp.]